MSLTVDGEKAGNFPGTQSSGEQAANAAILAGKGWLCGIEVVTDGTNDAKIILYDNPGAAAGVIKCEISVKGGDHYGGRIWAPPVRMTLGIYVVVSGTGASYFVEYIEGR